MKKLEIERAISRLASSVFLWACVAISFPIVVLLAHFMGTGININASSLIQIAKYFDEKLMTGIIAGSVIYFLVILAISKIRGWIKPKSKDTATRDALDEISSQVMGIGSIIIVSNLAIFSARHISFFKIPDNLEISDWGFGILFWIIGLIISL